MYKVERIFDHRGLKCVVTYNTGGFRCGYVGVDKSHCLYECGFKDHCPILEEHAHTLVNFTPLQKDLDILMSHPTDNYIISPRLVFSVHGGITWSGGGPGSQYPIDSDLWWFGYDCNHAWDKKDLSCARKDSLLEMVVQLQLGEHRTLEYCENECKQLAEQLYHFQSKIRREYSMLMM